MGRRRRRRPKPNAPHRRAAESTVASEEGEKSKNTVAAGVLAAIGLTFMGVLKKFGDSLSPKLTGDRMYLAVGVIGVVATAGVFWELNRGGWKSLRRRSKALRLGTAAAVLFSFATVLLWLRAEETPATSVATTTTAATRPRGFVVSGSPDGAVIWVGSNRYVVPLDSTNPAPRELLIPGLGIDLGKFSISRRDEDLMLDADWYVGGPTDPPAIVVRQNRAVVRPTGWDWNADESGMEVIDELGNPIFQFERIGPSSYRISGYAVKGDASAAIGERAWHTSPHLPSVSIPTLNKQFMYPSIGHQGMRASPSKALSDG